MIVYDLPGSILGFSLLESSERLLLKEDERGTRSAGPQTPVGIMKLHWRWESATIPAPPCLCSWRLRAILFLCLPWFSAVLPLKLCLQVLCCLSGDQTESSAYRSASIITSMELLKLKPFPQVSVSGKFSLSPKCYALKLYYLLPH